MSVDNRPLDELAAEVNRDFRSRFYLRGVGENRLSEKLRPGKKPLETIAQAMAAGKSALDRRQDLIAVLIISATNDIHVRTVERS